MASTSVTPPSSSSTTTAPLETAEAFFTNATIAEKVAKLLGRAGLTSEQIVVELFARVCPTRGEAYRNDYCTRHECTPITLFPTHCDPFVSPAASSTRGNQLSPVVATQQVLLGVLESLELLEHFLVPLFCKKYRRIPYSPLVHLIIALFNEKSRLANANDPALAQLLETKVLFEGGRKWEPLLKTLLGHMTSFSMSHLTLSELSSEAEFFSRVFACVDNDAIRAVVVPYASEMLLKPFLPFLPGIKQLSALVHSYRVPVESIAKKDSAVDLSAVFFDRFFLAFYHHLKLWQTKRAEGRLDARAYFHYFIQTLTLFLDLLGQPVSGRYVAWLLCFWDPRMLAAADAPKGSAAATPQLRPHYLIDLVVSLLPTFTDINDRHRWNVTVHYLCYGAEIYCQPAKPSSSTSSSASSSSASSSSSSSTRSAVSHSISQQQQLLRSHFLRLCRAVETHVTLPGFADLQRYLQRSVFLPRFNLQFASLDDYLLRNFLLFRASIFGSIFQELGSAMQSTTEGGFFPLTRFESSPSLTCFEVSPEHYVQLQSSSFPGQIDAKHALLLAIDPSTTVLRMSACTIVSDPNWSNTSSSSSASKKTKPIEIHFANSTAGDGLEGEATTAPFTHVYPLNPATSASVEVLALVKDMLEQQTDTACFPPWIQRMLLGHLSPSATRDVNCNFQDDMFSVDGPFRLGPFLTGQAHVTEALSHLEIDKIASIYQPQARPGIPSSTPPNTLSYRFPAVTPLVSFSWTPPDPNATRRPSLNLYPAQRAAIVSSLLQRITLIQGPPGTGKTTVATSLIRVLHHNLSRSQQILLMAHSNLALDELIVRCQELPILRLGSRSNEPIAQAKTPKGKTDALLAELKEKLTQLEVPEGLVSFRDRDLRRLERDLPGALAAAKQPVTPENKDAIMSSARLLSMTVFDRESTFLANSPIIAVTCGGFRRYRNRLSSVRTLVLDEAGKILETETLIALLPTLSRLVMIGDAQQLSSVLKDSSLHTHSNYDQSLFERLERNGVRPVVLNRQARALPALANLYRSKYSSLEDHEDAAAALATRLERLQLGSFTRPVWLNVSGSTRGADGAETNAVEASNVLSIVGKLNAQGVESQRITVLTPYRAQKALLARQLNSAAITVCTTDEFQGKENDFIVISLVANGAAPSPHLRNPRRNGNLFSLNLTS